MKKMLNALMNYECASPFLKPVELREAPGYLDVVDTPMDLSTVKKKIQSGAYESDSSIFLNDINLIWANCIAYNDPDSEISSWAYKMSEFSATSAKEFDLGEIQWIGIAKKRAQSAGNMPVDKGLLHIVDLKRKKVNQSSTASQVSMSHKEMKQIVSRLQSYEFSSPFLYPVDLKDAPGYLELIKRPMDLSTILRNVKKGEYVGDSAKFCSDIFLIWDNCMRYNDPASDIYKWAEHCQRFSEELLPRSALNITLKSRQLQVNDQGAQSSGVESDNARQDEEIEGSDADFMDMEEDFSIEDSADNLQSAAASEKSRKRKNQITFRVRQYRSVMKQVFNHELAEPFRFPESSKGLLPGVVNPLDLSTIKNRIETYQESATRYLNDLKLVFDNYLTNCNPESEMYKTADTMKRFMVNTFFKTFPGMSQEQQKTENSAPSKATLKASAVAEEVIRLPTFKGGPLQSESAARSISKAELPPVVLHYDHRSFTIADTFVSELSCIVFSGSSGKVANLDKLIASSDFDDEQSRSQVVEYIRQRSEGLLSNTMLPYCVVSGLYEVLKFGVISKNNPAHSSQYIFPIGFSCRTSLKIAVVSEAKSESVEHASSVVAFVPVSLISTIKLTSSNEVSFVVSTEHGTEVGLGESPLEAWKSIIGREQSMLRCLGNKLHRCKSVFNRLCASSDSVPFLEQVPLDTSAGASYYKVITAPMWLREVHQRLAKGEYDNEFDFAWDMRLIFRNCRNYNMIGSDLYIAAQRLGTLFEALFARWVHSVIDKSVNAPAKGPWDDWTSLRYFDSLNSVECFCVKTGTRAKPNELLQCSWCEDQYLPSSVGLPVSKLVSKDSWACSRCEQALLSANNDMAGDPFVKNDQSALISDVYNDAVFYVPAPEIGEGWCQAKRKNHSGLKQLYLSPLGYEIHNKDEIAGQKAFEEAVDLDLITTRENEFKDQLPAIRRSKPRRSSRSSDAQATGATSSTQQCVQDPVDAESLDDGRMLTGKLYDFVPTQGYRLAWLVCSKPSVAVDSAKAGKDPSSIISRRTELTPDLLPPCGYFGLDLTDIRVRIEGLKNVASCVEYCNYHFDRFRAECKEDILLKKKEMEVSTSATHALMETLCNERWFWRKHYMHPELSAPAIVEAPCESSTELISTKPGFKPFLLGSLPHSILESVLCLWDFLEAIQTSIGSPYFSLLDLVKSVNPPNTMLTTCSQMIFDEVNCILSEYLLEEVRVLTEVKDEKDWQDIAMVLPVNVITWPAVAERVLLAMSLPLSHSEIKSTLVIPMESERLTQLKVLALLYNHPCSYDLLVPNIEEVPIIAQFALQITNLKHMLIHSRAEDISSLNDFASLLMEAFAAILRDQAAIRFWNQAQVLGIWTQQVLMRLEITRVIDLNLTLSKSDQEEVVVHKNRAWGGFTHRHADVFNSFVLKPYDFSFPRANASHIKLEALNNLEKSLFTLTSLEPESWSAHVRVAVYSTLVDYSIVTKSFEQFLHTSHQFHEQCLSSLPKGEESIITRPDYQFFKIIHNLPKRARCHFTGVTSSLVPDPSLWTTVPIEFQGQPEVFSGMTATTEQSDDILDSGGIAKQDSYLFRVRSHKSSSSSVRTKGEAVYALKEALTRVINCRKVALLEQSSSEVRRFAAVKAINAACLLKLL
jgi:hypothetical protein